MNQNWETELIERGYRVLLTEDQENWPGFNGSLVSVEEHRLSVIRDRARYS